MYQFTVVPKVVAASKETDNVKDPASHLEAAVPDEIVGTAVIIVAATAVLGEVELHPLLEAAKA